MSFPAGPPEQLDFHRYTILIVDDNPTNLGVVFDYLEQYGFTLLVAQSGESGLQKAEYARPDIILLDVMMPDLDGFETCRLLKSNDKTADIPVIFMTALGDIESKLKGFEVGAVDYVTKPLHQAELLARIATHLRLRQLTHDLQQANDELQKLNANKDKFFSIVAHDLRGPFTPLLMRAQMLARQSGKLSQEKMARMGESIYQSALQIAGLLETLLQWARLQMGHVYFEPAELDLAPIIHRNVNLIANQAAPKQITIHAQLDNPVLALADEQVVDTVVRNLLSNAIKFTPAGGSVTISAGLAQDGQVEIVVSDTGVGINPDDLEKLFKIGVKHSTPGTANEAGAGLGLLLCHEMLTRSGGAISIHSAPGQGATAHVTLAPKNNQ